MGASVAQWISLLLVLSLLRGVLNSNLIWTLLARDTGRSLPTLLDVNRLRPNNDLTQTSHCNIKGLSVREVMRTENMITQVKFY